MTNRTSLLLACLTAILLSCALALAEPPAGPAGDTDAGQVQRSDQPADAQPPRHAIGQNVRRLPGRPPAGRLSAEQEDELLEFLQAQCPDRYEAMVKLGEDNPRRYRFVISRMWAWYQQWKDMSPQAQEAAIVVHDLRVEVYMTLRQWRREEDPAKKEQLKSQLRETLDRHFDAEQRLREIQLEELEERIEEVRRELQQRQEDRDSIIDGHLNRMLQYRPQRHGQGDDSSPAGATSGEDHHQPAKAHQGEQPSGDGDQPDGPHEADG